MATEKLTIPELLGDFAGGPEEPEEEAMEVEVPPEMTEDFMEEPEEEEVEPEHSDNLAEYLDENELRVLAQDLIQKIESDLDSRKDWITTYEDGLEYLGFSQEERSEPFEGASGVFHPVLSEAVVRFQSNAIMEVFPASGPVNVRLYGDEIIEKIMQAKRVKEEFNYLLTEKMTEYRKEMEQLLFRLPLSGSVFKKVCYNTLKGKPEAIMVRGEDFVIDHATSDLDSSERYTHILKKTSNEIKKLQRSGFYKKVKLQDPSPKYREAEEREERLSGTRASMESDDRHILYECHVHVNLPEPFADPDDIADPYIITIHPESGEILSIYRNWNEEDEIHKTPIQYFVHYQYMPGLGFYGIGLIHLLGSIAKASTSILRQLIDAGTFSNLPGGLKTKGLRTVGDDTPIAPGEWRDVDVPTGAIRDNLFPLPYKEPSAVLAQLLTAIVEEGRRIGSIADVEIGSMSEQAPVGTTMAIMERSLKVMSAVHARLHASLKKELGLIARVVFEYMPPFYEWDAERKFNRKQDFDGRVDVVPVSDPNSATQSQKIVQLQAVTQLAQMNPELYNLKELHRDGLNAIGIKDTERLIPIDKDPPRMDPIQENMAVLTSQPIKVYPDQDHEAHIQAHISAMTDPMIREMVGQSQAAPRVMAAMEAHIAEHFAFQYRNEVSRALGMELPPMGQPLDPQIENKIAKLAAEGAQRVKDEHTRKINSQKAQEVLEDPVFKLKMRELEIRERELAIKERQAAADILLEKEKMAAKERYDYANLESQEARAAGKIGADLITFGVGLEKEERMQAIELAQDAEKAIQDNLLRRKEIDARKADKAAKGRTGQ